MFVDLKTTDIDDSIGKRKKRAGADFALNKRNCGEFTMLGKLEFCNCVVEPGQNCKA